MYLYSVLEISKTDARLIQITTPHPIIVRQWKKMILSGSMKTKLNDY